MCFSLGLLENLLLWLIAICVVVAIIRVLMPLVMAPFPIVIAILNILMWGLIASAAVIILFDLFSCLFAGLPRLRP